MPHHKLTFKIDSNNPNLTLKDTFIHQFLFPTTLWTLGLKYEEHKENLESLVPGDFSMRILALESPWQIALSIHNCVRAKKIFQTHSPEQKHKDLIPHIDHQLETAIEKLWEIKKSDDSRKTTHWDKQVYETATVLWALKSYLTAYPQTSQKVKIEKQLEWGFRWIFEELTNNLSITHYAGISPLVWVIAAISTFEVKEWKKIYRKILITNRQNSKKLPTFSDLLQQFLNFVNKSEKWEQENIKAADEEENIYYVIFPMWCILGDSKHTKRELGNVYFKMQQCLHRSLKQRTKRHLRQSLNREHNNVSKAISSYILLQGTFRKTKATTFVDNLLLISSYAKIARSDYQFNDGSIYHDLYTTSYFMRAILDGIEYWKYAEDTSMIQVYNDVLKATTSTTLNQQDMRYLNELEEENMILKEKSTKSANQRNRTLDIASAIFYSFSVISIAIIGDLDILGILGSLVGVGLIVRSLHSFIKNNWYDSRTQS